MPCGLYNLCCKYSVFYVIPKKQSYCVNLHNIYTLHYILVSQNSSVNCLDKLMLLYYLRAILLSRSEQTSTKAIPVYIFLHSYFYALFKHKQLIKLLIWKSSTAGNFTFQGMIRNTGSLQHDGTWKRLSVKVTIKFREVLWLLLLLNHTV